MLLLAADTSGKHGSIALAHCGPEQACRTLEVVPLAGGTFSAQLVPQIAALLREHGFRKQDIGGFAVVSGPGSFTGLRVGLAAIKALAEVLAKPVAAVSLLEVIARSGRTQGKVVAALDAGRAQVYLGEYEITGAAARALSERLVTRPEFMVAAAASVIVTPDSGLAEAARGVAPRVEQIEFPRADSIACLGWRKIRVGEVISPQELDANYIRRSEAEIFLKTRS
jgi:tRNA threonylcarbamoyladenosine biosynthesis protein TsaB